MEFCAIEKGFLNSKVLSVPTRLPEFRDSAPNSKAECGSSSLQFRTGGQETERSLRLAGRSLKLEQSVLTQ